MYWLISSLVPFSGRLDLDYVLQRTVVSKKSGAPPGLFALRVFMVENLVGIMGCQLRTEFRDVDFGCPLFPSMVYRCMSLSLLPS